MPCILLQIYRHFRRICLQYVRNLLHVANFQMRFLGILWFSPVQMPAVPQLLTFTSFPVHYSNRPTI
jgi:hypothetical protein